MKRLNVRLRIHWPAPCQRADSPICITTTTTTTTVIFKAMDLNNNGLLDRGAKSLFFSFFSVVDGWMDGWAGRGHVVLIPVSTRPT
jgi:hypothetical protein